MLSGKQLRDILSIDQSDWLFNVLEPTYDQLVQGGMIYLDE